jgi:hypothetical protein
LALSSIADGRSIAFVIRDLLETLSGNSIELLPVLPSHEELLGIIGSEAIEVEPSKGPGTTPPVRPAKYLKKEDSRPRIRGLHLTPESTGKLRKRARQERTTVHGALSAALALAYRQTNLEWREAAIRICSLIDTRKMLGLGEDCAVLVDAEVVAIEPRTSAGFWHIARDLTAGLAGAQTLEGVFASRYTLHQMVRNGIDVPTAAAICANAFAHEVMLTNLGELPCGTDFGELKLDAVWGPAVSARFERTPTIGAVTTNGALRLLETSFNGSLLNFTKEILIAACAD